MNPWHGSGPREPWSSNAGDSESPSGLRTDNLWGVEVEFVLFEGHVLSPEITFRRRVALSLSQEKYRS